jgi:D-ribose pyranose/furanose isomerase RbsD
MFCTDLQKIFGVVKCWFTRGISKFYEVLAVVKNTVFVHRKILKNRIQTLFKFIKLALNLKVSRKTH